jgi:hypothetical protein
MVGKACLEYQDAVLRNLPCKRIECDEIWAFCYCKDKNVPYSMLGQPGVGSVWTWTAIDAETKLVPSWKLGDRNIITAHAFIADLLGRLANRVQLTTDGNKMYIDAVMDNFTQIDYAMLQKLYGNAGEGPEARYSPGVCHGIKKETILGNPDPQFISTSYAERQNLNIR